MLMNESSSHLIWEAARTNVPDLPPKPEDMDEPAYANLMYDAHCHVCIVSFRLEKFSRLK